MSSSSPHPQEQIYSYAHYLTWTGDERWEILNGKAYLQAAPSRIHQEILMELSRQIANYLTGKPCQVYPAPFCVRLDHQKENEEVKNVVEPDITIVCDRTKLDERGCKGAPDMIIEIMSPSSGRKDRVDKFNKYEKSGVKEYWVVEPHEKLVSVFILQADGRYGRTNMYTEEDQVKITIFPDFWINLGTVFDKA